MRALLILTVLAVPAHAASLDVTVTNVRSAKGIVRVAVCDKASFLQPHCPYIGRAPAQPGQVTVHIDGIPPGTYAAQAYQDENENGVIDKSFFGLPTEGIGFSNDAPMRFGPPRFDDAAFVLQGTRAAIRFALRYF